MRDDFITPLIAGLVAGSFGIKMILARRSFHDFACAGYLNSFR